MSTHAMIAVIDEDGNGRAMYVHMDGHPEGVVPVLSEWYDNYIDAELLVDAGYMSDLGPVPYCDDPYYEFPKVFTGGLAGLQELAYCNAAQWVYAFRENPVDSGNGEWVYAKTGDSQFLPMAHFAERMGPALHDRVVTVASRFEEKFREQELKETITRRKEILIF